MVEAREGTDSAERRARGRTEGEEKQRASERVGPEGRQRRRRVPEGVRRTVGGRERSSSGSGSSTAATAGGRRGVGKTWSRGLLQSLRGQRESAAPAARSLARLLAQPSPSSPPSALATHTRVLRRRVRMHARIHKRTGPRRGVQFRARTHACTPCCRNRGYSRPRKRESLNRFSPSPLLLRASSSFCSPASPPLLPTLFYVRFFYPSSSQVDRGGGR